ncbi:hypothetical protein [Flavivirga sp. 57AJ16]|uniref:hypothetical protein n=1 Tax=Flavivirga sp. 57AJ16 TaxID=3025307 RepID=UPI002366C29E|nr:hypothetical protein [Flavivirga sp. 57AJ16]MDD7885156.1 hypothetical protein [Flavivirga sp. 57AJ16]
MRVFKEEQRFTQKWLIVLLSISSIFPIFIITKIFLVENSMNLLEYISIMGMILIAIGFIFIFKLKTRIDEIGIHYQFFPFHFKMKTIFWGNIKSAKTRKYNALSEYGGWGLKGSWLGKKNNGIAINIKGNIGIQLILVDEKKILIGTQKRFDADNVIARYLHKK